MHRDNLRPQAPYLGIGLLHWRTQIGRERGLGDAGPWTLDQKSLTSSQGEGETAQQTLRMLETLKEQDVSYYSEE